MKQLGSALFVIGVGSMILPFVHLEFRFLSWIDNWGPTVGWGIRIGLAVVGAVLWLVALKTAAPQSDSKGA